jgi:hypothetical protein
MIGSADATGLVFEVGLEFLIPAASTSAVGPNQLYVSWVTETALRMLDI